MHSGGWRSPSNDLVSKDTIIMAAHASAQRNYILRLLLGNLISLALMADHMGLNWSFFAVYNTVSVL